METIKNRSNVKIVPLKDLIELTALHPLSTVALIGNANSLFSKFQGKEIDQHDCVIRLNYGRVNMPEHQGTKTTLVGCSDDKITLSLIQEAFAPRAVIWLTNKTTPSHFFDCHKLPLYINSQDHWRQIANYVEPFRPSSGAIAAYFLRKILNIKNVDIYGFDFFTSPTFYKAHKHKGLLKLKFWRRKGRLNIQANTNLR